MVEKSERAAVYKQIDALRMQVAEDKAERAGRSRSMRVVVAVFGGTFTAALVGFFLWMQSMNASAQSQAMGITTLTEHRQEQAQKLDTLSTEVTAHDRELVLLRQQYRDMSRRFEQQEALQQEVLTEIRRRPRRRR